MEREFYKCIIKDYDYCIFLDNSTVACYFNQLSDLSFKKKKVIIDQLFFTGNKSNRFITFDTIEGKIDFKTAKNIKLSKEFRTKIDSIVLTKYSNLCQEYLSSFDCKSMSEKCVKAIV